MGKPGETAHDRMLWESVKSSKYGQHSSEECDCHDRGLLGSLRGLQKLRAIGEIILKKIELGNFDDEFRRTFTMEQKLSVSEKNKTYQSFIDNANEIDSFSNELSGQVDEKLEDNFIKDDSNARKHIGDDKDSRISYAIELDIDETFDGNIRPCNAEVNATRKQIPFYRIKRSNDVFFPSRFSENPQITIENILMGKQNEENDDVINTDASSEHTNEDRAFKNEFNEIVPDTTFQKTVPNPLKVDYNGRSLHLNATTLTPNVPATLQMHPDPLLAPETRHPQQNYSHARLVPVKNASMKPSARNNDGKITKENINGERRVSNVFEKFLEENRKEVAMLEKTHTGNMEAYAFMLSSPTRKFTLKPQEALSFKRINSEIKAALYFFEFYLLISSEKSYELATFYNFWKFFDTSVTSDIKTDDGFEYRTSERSSLPPSDDSTNTSRQVCDCRAFTLGIIAGFSTLTTLLGYALSFTAA
ncbi:uncharacterized protein LOC125178152 [Hyalella azteca]|uniref:Uncharacterized protein LOC125178152 n=1 Tax=Hyalella azteca TaxID=294128 RepID=A0A979FLX8_HYAAZ|nr:uncharacterized protein LOC125178152 [Hyalella azteca]